ncbi:MAG TPA: hypothetical protein VFJ47_10190 [Terriglobales bacterium]|nr:hypothetical protein [Terriglobales bacterium]
MKAYVFGFGREALDRMRELLGVSPDVQQHLAHSRIEFLKAIRTMIDQRITHLSSTGQQSTKIPIE